MSILRKRWNSLAGTSRKSARVTKIMLKMEKAATGETAAAFVFSINPENRRGQFKPIETTSASE